MPAARIDYLNPVAERLTGWSLDEARGRPIGDVLQLIDESTRKPVAYTLDRVLVGRRDLGALRSHRARELAAARSSPSRKPRRRSAIARARPSARSSCSAT